MTEAVTGCHYERRKLEEVRLDNDGLPREKEIGYVFE